MRITADNYIGLSFESISQHKVVIRVLNNDRMFLSCTENCNRLSAVRKNQRQHRRAFSEQWKS
jgi:translation initiation factor IF-1